MDRNQLIIYFFNVYSPLRNKNILMMSLVIQMIILILMMMIGWECDNYINKDNDTDDTTDDEEENSIDGDKNDATTESEKCIQSNANINFL